MSYFYVLPTPKLYNAVIVSWPPWLLDSEFGNISSYYYFPFADEIIY